MEFITGDGGKIKVGREIARGGEGSILEVLGSAGIVAKIYHHLPDKQKQSKLRFMAANSSDSLHSFTTWPKATLHKAQGGAVVGFLKQRISDCVLIHNLYSPAHRRQEFPRVGWDFLLRAARNTAAAFDSLHTHGHILGDVNQGNVMVRRDSRVLLVDSDSIQIQAPTEVYYCEVGVGHFTPPELQGISGFAGVRRTAQHDVFGLALLIFHLLFGGRHPYSGVPLMRDAGNSLEEDIKALRFAYARDAQDRGIAPPPRSIPVSLMPANVEGMFRYAFTEPGIKGQRPTAANWVTALDDVLRDLQRCETATLHCYPQHRPTCPWCELDNSGVVYFVDVSLPPLAGAVFDIAKVWSQIEVLACPPVLAALTQPSPVSPRPLPSSANRKGEVVVYRGFVLAAALGLSIAAPNLFLVFLLAAWIGCASIGYLGESERSAERHQREAALKEAMSATAEAETDARLASGVDEFTARRQRLMGLRNDYLSLASIEQREIAALQSTAQSRQLRKFLEAIFIDDADISGVGPAKKAALRSFGIETAADVEWNRVNAVKGFGNVLTLAVVQWRQHCERRFRFDPQRAVAQADIDAVKAKCAHRRKQVEVELAKGPNDLRIIQQQGQTKASAIQAKLATVATRLAQARADMTVFS